MDKIFSGLKHKRLEKGVFLKDNNIISILKVTCQFGDLNDFYRIEFHDVTGLGKKRSI